jgi:predicted phage terminase large subunit-like protein
VKGEFIRYYEEEEKPQGFSFVLQSLDTANKGGDSNDYSVCTTWGMHGGNFYLLHVFRKRLTYPDLKREVVALFKKFNPSKLLIEDKSSGTALIQELKSAGVFRIEPYAPPPGSDKFYRFWAQAIKFENGRVFLPRRAPWLDEYVREITGFPGTKHDDQVDSTSQALEFLGNKANGMAIWERLGRL